MNNFNQEDFCSDKEVYLESEQKTYKEWLEQSTQKTEDIGKRVANRIRRSEQCTNIARTRKRKQNQTLPLSPVLQVPSSETKMNTKSSTETSVKIQLEKTPYLTSPKTDMQLNSCTETLLAGGCRACLQVPNPDTSMHCLFKAWDTPWDGMGNTIAEDLSNIANIPLSETDMHSKLICDICLVSLRNACAFVNVVRNNELGLGMKYAHPPIEINVSSETMWPKPMLVDASYSSAVVIKEEVLTDDEYRELNVTSDLKSVDDIKIEPEEIVEQTCHEYSHITMNGSFPLSQPNDKEMQQNGSNESDEFEEEFLDSAVKSEPPSEVEDELETVHSDLPLECLLCTKQFKSVSGLKVHVIAQHSYGAVKRKTEDDCSIDEKKNKTDKHTCATCRRHFTTSTELMVHETCHNKHVCYSCNRMFDTFSHLSEHTAYCSAVNNKPAIKPKTLEDVKRQPIADTKLPDNDDDEHHKFR